MQTVDLYYEVTPLSARLNVKHCFLALERFRQTITIRKRRWAVYNLLPYRAACTRKSQR